MAKKNITPKEEELEISSPSVSDNSTPSDSPTPKAEESKEPTAEKAQGGFYGATVNPQLDNPDEWYDGEIEPAVAVATPSLAKVESTITDPNLGSLNVTPKDNSLPKVETKITDPNLGSLNVTPKTNTQPVETKEDSLSTLRKAYDPQIEALGTTIGEMQKAYDKAKEQDKVTQRRERNMQMIAGISDGLAGLANLIGTGSYGSSHINLKEAFANPVLQKKFEEAQKERKKDIKDINERLSQKEKELLAMKLAYGKDMSSLLADKEKAEANRAFQASEAEKTRTHQTTMQENQQEFTAGQNELNRDVQVKKMQQDYDIALKNLKLKTDEADRRSKYPVMIGDETVDIPIEMVNDKNIGEIFHNLPEEFKKLAKGKEIYQYETRQGKEVKVGTGRYEQPKLEEMLAAIGAASRDNVDVQNSLRRLAGLKPLAKEAKPKSSESEDAGIDHSHENAVGSMSHEVPRVTPADPFAEFK